MTKSHNDAIVDRDCAPGLSREEAIVLAEECYRAMHTAEDRDPHTAYRQALIDLLTVLASAGAFHDGRNMVDRLQGRFRK